MTTTVPEQGDAAQAPDPREGYIEGLEALAQLLREHPEVPLPSAGKDPNNSITLYLFDEPLAHARTLIPHMTGTSIEVDTAGSYYGVNVHGTLAGLSVRLYMKAEDVCERRVTGRATSPDDRVLQEVVEWQLPAELLDAVAQADEPACRLCGCTENEGCPGGCVWVPDPEGKGELCSSHFISAETLVEQQIVRCVEWNDGDPVRILRVQLVAGPDGETSVRYQDVAAQHPAFDVLVDRHHLVLPAGGSRG
ncbi:hypothetical protein [Microbispora sp. CA-102843]|uniref:hypothetical protein n=1 Tax=Microbispora sp. CA-102843 TaxID=3239952 RepID=UPI003D9209EB